MQSKMQSWARVLGLILLAFLWIGCSSEDSTPTPTVMIPTAIPPATLPSTPKAEPSPTVQEISVVATPTPAERNTSPDAAYPAPGQVMTRAYPEPEATSIFSQDEPKFSLDEPLLTGATTVSGQGPSGVEIAIVDVTLMAEVLGTGQINEDGLFSLSVDPPLVANHFIGITVLSIRGEEISAENVVALYPFVGDQARDIPHPAIDLLWDTANVVGAP